MMKYVAFLRGINVGGHHKVPMADLKKLMGKLKFRNVVTILNSGNIIFDSHLETKGEVEDTIATNLERQFGFRVPTMVRTAEEIVQLHRADPFKGIPATKTKILYVSFVRHDVGDGIKAPWTSDDKSFQILGTGDKAVKSVLDLSKSNTPKAMELLEKTYGKENITTRSWKTIERVIGKL